MSQNWLYPGLPSQSLRPRIGTTTLGHPICTLHFPSNTNAHQDEGLRACVDVGTASEAACSCAVAARAPKPALDLSSPLPCSTPRSRIPRLAAASDGRPSRRPARRGVLPFVPGHCARMIRPRLAAEVIMVEAAQARRRTPPPSGHQRRLPPPRGGRNCVVRPPCIRQRRRPRWTQHSDPPLLARSGQRPGPLPFYPSRNLE